MVKQNKNTWLFIGFLVLAAIANLLSHLFGAMLGSLMTALNYVILTGLLLFWIRSVWVRLLPTAARTSMLTAAYLLLFYMLLRIFQYRCAVEPLVKRYTDYAYWIPQMLVPALFFITFIRIWHKRDTNHLRYELLFLIPASLLSILAMTNDLHGLVYKPLIDLSHFTVSGDTYKLGPAYYIMYVWMIISYASGLFILLRNVGRLPRKTAFILIGIIALWFGTYLFNSLFLYRTTDIRLLNLPETHTFGMLGVFEVCIRYRLIPYNENYTGFYHKLHFPSVITDRVMEPVYLTEVALNVDKDSLQAALEKPVALPQDQKLYGKAIRGGYAFWTVDESSIHMAQQRLEEANETIEQENDLLRAETEQKEKDAYLTSRHRIYHEIAAELYPYQKRIEKLLDSAHPHTESFKDTIAMVSVLNAYVKRKTNLLLLAAENEELSLKDLFLALQETAGYLTLAGLTTQTMNQEDAFFQSHQIISLYDAFEFIAEQLLGNASMLMVSWNRGALRLAAETEKIPETSALPVNVTIRKNDTILYMDIPAEMEATV